MQTKLIVGPLQKSPAEVVHRHCLQKTPNFQTFWQSPSKQKQAHKWGAPLSAATLQPGRPGHKLNESPGMDTYQLVFCVCFYFEFECIMWLKRFNTSILFRVLMYSQLLSRPGSQKRLTSTSMQPVEEAHLPPAQSQAETWDVTLDWAVSELLKHLLK